MKTFNDLIFKSHPTLRYGLQAVMNFDNGYGISVVYGNPFLYCSEHTYEVAVLKDNKLCYDTPITDDVLGYQTQEDITNIMKQIQSL